MGKYPDWPERFWVSSSLLWGRPRSCSMFSTSSSASAIGRPFNSEKKRMCSATVILRNKRKNERGESRHALQIHHQILFLFITLSGQYFKTPVQMWYMCWFKCVKSYILLEKGVVLRAHSQRQTDGVHVCANVFAVNGGGAGGGRKHTRQDGPGRERQTQKEICCLPATQRIHFVGARACMSNICVTYKVVVFPAPLCPRNAVIWLS